MNYNATSHIKSVQDVKVFFHHLAFDRKLSFHPDDDFTDYTNFSDGTLVFARQEAELYNRLMNEAFDVCNKANVEIYKLGLDTLVKTFNKAC